MTKVEQTKINEIIREFIKDSLDEEEDIRINRQRPLTDDSLHKRAEFLGILQVDHREALAKSDSSSTISRQMTDKVIHKTNGLDIKKDSEDCRKLKHSKLKHSTPYLF
jgi:hypothetical protein